MELQVDVAVVGGGAAGFFFTAQLLERSKGLNICILEKTTKLLSKVKISGGGRCNLTHNCENPKQLAKNYPRGEQALRQVFRKFGVNDTIDWFEKRGVAIKAEPDGRMFPKSNSSQSVIDALMQACDDKRVEIKTKAGVDSITPTDKGYCLELADGDTMHAKYVFVASGGFAKTEGYNWLRALGLAIVEPVPSLFTFNLPNHPIISLPGVSVPVAMVSLPLAKLKNTGPLLITHWGLSGPAILGLSAWGARYLYDEQYNFKAIVDWLPNSTQEVLSQTMFQLKDRKSNKQVSVNGPFGLPKRLWVFFCETAGIAADERWLDLPNKKINKLVQLIKYFEFNPNGKTTYKEEFVTSGGVDIAEINTETMESLKHPNLFFGGELLNIDGITGGFNFQAAWSTAYLAANTIAQK